MILDITTHKNILLQLLKDIYSDVTIGPILGFKGGTAVYLFYNLNRFSVDLDFDLLDEKKADYVFQRVQEIIKEYGIVKEARKKRYTLFFLISYGEKNRNIKIEVNLRDFGSRYEVKNYLGIAMKVMAKEDMFANKLVAMLERIGTTNRDIFDVWFFLKNNWQVNKEIVTKRTNMSFKTFLQKCVKLLTNTNDQHILSGIGELLDTKQKIWVKSNLRKDTIFLLKIKLTDNQ